MNLLLIDIYHIDTEYIFRTINYGYSRFFANTTHLNFQFVGDQRGELHDNFWMTLY